ncbi:MAG: MurR/RpiR family transcriptional regulator [Thermomicrobiales bacterium]
MGTAPAGLDFDRFEQLSPKHQMVARCVAENPAFAAFATANELGARAGVSTATVVRFAQALGFNGYNEFQQNARHSYLRTLQPSQALQARNENGRDIFAAQLYQDIENLRRTLHSLHGAELLDVAKRIDRAHEIVIIGSGSYAAIGMILGHQLRFMGYRAHVENRGGPHLTAAISPLTSKDLVIGISFWKGVRETINAVSWAHRRGIPTVALTDTVFSPIAKAADIAIAIPSEGVSFFQSMVAPLSVIYGLIAQLAHDADEARKQIMKEAEESYDILEIAYPG